MDNIVFITKLDNITEHRFCFDVAQVRSAIRKSTADKILFFEKDSYRFCVGFFALACENRHILLPPNAQVESIEQIILSADACLGGQHFLTKNQPNSLTNIVFELSEYDQSRTVRDLNHLFSTFNSQITFFTSGTTGKAKAIEKHTSLLLSEVDVLIDTFKEKIKSASFVLSTVAHYHIYGLLFKLLLPLKAKLKVVSQAFEYPEHISQFLANIDQEKSLIISSPAHLKRLVNDNVLISQRHRLSAIFSSGGPLPFESAQSLYGQLKQAPIEVFGSTETGGIAWRCCQSPIPSPWTILAGLSYFQDKKSNRLIINSPFITEKNYLTDDLIESLDENHFILKGRADRTIKIEEKRLNLVHMEHRLNNHHYVTEARVLVIGQNSRQVLVAVVEVNKQALQLIAKQGKRVLNNELKDHLLGEFERICLPKKWRYVEDLSYNLQGKVSLVQLESLFD